MVYRRKTAKRASRRRRTFKKRTYTRKRKTPQMKLYAGRSIIANRYRTKLMYSDFFTLSTPGTGILWHQFNMNSLFKPDFTNAGHQPRGFDQLMTLFQSYIVTGMKIKVEGRFLSSNLDTNPVVGNLILGYLTVNGGTLPTDMTDASESRNYITVTRGDQTAFNVSKYFDVARCSGIPRSRVFNDVQYTGTVSTSPAVVPLVNLGFVGMNSSIAIGVYYNVTIQYYVTFQSPIQMVRS